MCQCHLTFVLAAERISPFRFSTAIAREHLLPNAGQFSTEGSILLPACRDEVFDCTWPAFSRAARKTVEALCQLKVKREQSQYVQASKILC
jgi:hypothetical protein